ncbi:MAG: 4-hydroxy-3-methylbut-2-en-1-yl diphosphate synthase [Chitinophagaceae bacterium]|nr:MAG: 4-hydroxy-3-methylbut-2-en-1-yl diphosphate synthase [Chitinophagaceae bacterium]
MRLKTREVKIGDLLLGNFHPIRVQTMTTTDTMATSATVEQTIRCIEAGSEMVRITAPSKKEAENLLNIKNELRERGFTTPLIADIHFTPFIDYTDKEYGEEIERIRERFTPLVRICKEYGTAMRIGTNHGSLSDRIMSRYGDTPMGMVESAMEFLRIARAENYHNIVLSMKSSNPQVMVQAYRLLVRQMQAEFNECYPLHLGVTEAGDGEDGRIKSAIGIGTLLEEGIGDTIRVSLTEDPEFEIPVCINIVKRYEQADGEPDVRTLNSVAAEIPTAEKLPYDPYNYVRRKTFEIQNIGGSQVPVVVADLSKLEKITASDLQNIGYRYDEQTDKWHISDAAADYMYTGKAELDFALPGTLKVITLPNHWAAATDKSKYFPIYAGSGFANAEAKSDQLNFVMIDCYNTPNPDQDYEWIEKVANDPTVVICLGSRNREALSAIRRMFVELMNRKISNPVLIMIDSFWQTIAEHLVHFSTEAGALFLDGFGDGIFLGMTTESYNNDALRKTLFKDEGRIYRPNQTIEQFLNNTAFSILQATRTRISRTEYISCPSCGRTLFDLQETTAKIRAVTNHLKGLKIAVMGCIVNGPGEMADADFGYVGSGPGKITLYKGKEVVKRSVNSDIAVEELINLLKENGAWLEPAQELR